MYDLSSLAYSESLINIDENEFFGDESKIVADSGCFENPHYHNGDV
jgi:hypothetical protein